MIVVNEAQIGRSDIHFELATALLKGWTSKLTQIQSTQSRAKKDVKLYWIVWKRYT